MFPALMMSRLPYVNQSKYVKLTFYILTFEQEMASDEVLRDGKKIMLSRNLKNVTQCSVHCHNI